MASQRRVKPKSPTATSPYYDFWNADSAVMYPRPMIFGDYRQKSSIRPAKARQKNWCELAVCVYKVGFGLFHSSLAVDHSEFHFWEHYGVQKLPRYPNDDSEKVSCSHMPLASCITIGSVSVSAERLSQICNRLSRTKYVPQAYDLVNLNCNHFVFDVLAELGLEDHMPAWINKPANVAEHICRSAPSVRKAIDWLFARRVGDVASPDYCDNDSSPSEYSVSTAPTSPEIYTTKRRVIFSQRSTRK